MGGYASNGCVWKAIWADGKPDRAQGRLCGRNDDLARIMFLRLGRSGSGEGAAESRSDMSLTFFRNAYAPTRSKLPFHRTRSQSKRRSAKMARGARALRFPDSSRHRHRLRSPGTGVLETTQPDSAAQTTTSSPFAPLPLGCRRT